MDVTALISLYTSGLAKQTNNQAIDTSNTTGDFASYLTNALTNNTSLESLLPTNTISSDSLNLLTNNLTTNLASNDVQNTVNNSFSPLLTENLTTSKLNMQQSYEELIKQIGDHASLELLAKKEQPENDLKVFENMMSTQDSSNSFSGLNNLSNSFASSFNGLDTLFASNQSNETSNNVDNSFGDMLTSSFQTKLMSNLNVAKSKMQQSYVDYVSRVGVNPPEAALARIEEMKNNIQAMDGFMTTKLSEMSAKQAYSQNANANITAQLNSTMNGLF